MAKDPIKKAENGTYYFRANLGFHPITGKQIQKYKSGFKTKKEAREAYSKLMLTSTEELTEKKQQLSFQQFIEETYLPWYKTQVKESTYLNRRSTIQKHFSYFYKMTVDEIEPINVQNWQLELAKEFSPNYIRIVQGMLSIAFDRAVVLGLAKKNPSRMIGNIKSKKTKVDFWTLDEFQKVISLLYKGDYYEHYLFISYWLLFMTGMRIGEAAALQWSDINFETGLLSITKTLYYKTMDEYKFMEPKTQASIRTIYIDTDTIKELKAWQEVQQKVLKGCDLVLSYNGIPTSKHTLPRALEKLAGLAGVHRIKIHALRHPYVKHTTKIFSLRLMDFQAQAYPDARRKTRGACQLLRVGQSRSPVRPLYNRKRFSCLPPQSKMSWILYAISMRLSGYTSTRSISISASSVVSASASKIALDASLRLSCRACSSCFCFACANTAA